MKKIANAIVLAMIIIPTVLFAIMNTVRVYSTDDLTAEVLENRNGKIIVEKVIGVCEDSEGNGKVLNTKDEFYNYISYKGVEGATKDAKYLTFFVYNPKNNETDDCIIRKDFLIKER